MTWVFIISTAIISIMAFSRHEWFHRLQFNPWMIRERKQGYRFFTYAFVHADWVHLGVNLFVLYSFGRVVEFFYGEFFSGMSTFYFILLYVGGVLLSVTPSYGKHKENPYYSAVGASGAVSAVVFSSIIIRPMSGIMIFPIPIEIPAIIFGVLYLIYSAYMAKRGRDNIGHDAHFWGAVYGVIFTAALKPSLLPRMIEQIF